LNSNDILPQKDGENPQAALRWSQVLVLVLLPPIAFLAWRLWRIYRARRFLKRYATTQQPEIEQLVLKGFDADTLFPSALLLPMAKELRQRMEVPCKALDVEITVEKTVRNAGEFTPVYGHYQVRPEYLVLVDRAHFGDHQARFVDELIDRLVEYGLLVTRYYFDDNPHTCFPGVGEGRPLTLAEIVEKNRQDRLLIFSDARGFFNARTGELVPWVDLLMRWEHRVLLTPKPLEHWGGHEQELSRKFMCLPATSEGLAMLGQSFSRGPSLDEPSKHPTVPLPEELRLRPRRWLERAAPEPSLVEDVLASLRRFLGEAGYYWLGACAVYPAMHWNLTLYLGNALCTANEDKLLQLHRFVALARLPWFRHNYMPDWLRMRLIAALSDDQELNIRLALEALLLNAVQGMVSSFQFEIVRQHRESLSTLAQPLLRLLARKTSVDSPLSDYVFLTFMAGRKKKLAVQLPKGMHYQQMLTKPITERLVTKFISDNTSRLSALSGLSSYILGYQILPKFFEIKKKAPFDFDSGIPYVLTVGDYDHTFLIHAITVGDLFGVLVLLPEIQSYSYRRIRGFLIVLGSIISYYIVIWVIMFISQFIKPPILVFLVSSIAGFLLIAILGKSVASVRFGNREVIRGTIYSAIAGLIFYISWLVEEDSMILSQVSILATYVLWQWGVATSLYRKLQNKISVMLHK
jgi:hypothetical protein